MVAEGAGPVRSRAPGLRRWGRTRRGTPDLGVLADGRRIAAALRGGLAEPGAAAAARGLRGLLDADAVGLGGLHGGLTWAGPAPDAATAARLAERVRGADTHAAAGDLSAVPLHARDELAGVLVVAGAVPARAVREAALWVGEALDRARLEASAEVAERAELRALRAEISPHFVYNSLTAIASFVRSDPERARDLMLDFAEYTRHSLARHGDYTTVAGEFQAIEAYLALARAVLGDRLRVQVRIAPEILPVALPYLVLQPLVENAVRHGVELPGGQRAGAGQRGGRRHRVRDRGRGRRARAWIPSSRRPCWPAGAPRAAWVWSTWTGGCAPCSAPATGWSSRPRSGAGTRVLLRLPRFQPGVVA